MSTEGPHTLTEYLCALVLALEQGEPASFARLAALVGARQAAIGLDEQWAECGFRELPARGDNFEAFSTDDPEADLPRGRATRSCIQALMNGKMDFNEAVMSGAFELRGSIDDVQTMATAVEIMISAGTRVPAIPAIARRFREQVPHRLPPNTPDHRDALERHHFDTLSRLGLLPWS